VKVIQKDLGNPKETNTKKGGVIMDKGKKTPTQLAQTLGNVNCQTRKMMPGTYASRKAE